MLVVIALGDNALLPPGGPKTADHLRAHVRLAAKAMAPIAATHQLIIGHGNGPQAGLLALEGAAYARVETYSPDVLGPQNEGMIDYLLEQELGNLLPFDRPIATILTMVEIDPCDPAFKNPTKFIGPIYLRDEAERLTSEMGWTLKPDGNKWRRVVASPEPQRIFELRPIKWLLEHNTIVIAAGGGGIPAMCEKGKDRRLAAAGCVIDTDLAMALLAREMGADLFVMLTDSESVCVDQGQPTQKVIRRASPDALAAMSLAAGSMKPKVAAACRFATETGKPAAIGGLADLERILAGAAGTTITAGEAGIAYAGAAAPIANVGKA